jgi:Magnesium chelatase, subunit ChlI
VTEPPNCVCAPHHTATKAAIVGGGSGVIRPGAASLAHHGCLFLDEASEFPRPGSPWCWRQSRVPARRRRLASRTAPVPLLVRRRYLVPGSWLSPAPRWRNGFFRPAPRCSPGAGHQVAAECRGCRSASCGAGSVPSRGGSGTGYERRNHHELFSVSAETASPG